MNTMNPRSCAATASRVSTLMRLAVTTSLLIHGAAHAQTAPAGGAAAPAAAPATAPAGNTNVTGGQAVSFGATLGTPSPAVPTPNPNLTTNAALPERRGFVRAEPFFIYPWVGVGLGHNSNLTGTAANPISSSFMVVSPRVDAELKTGAHLHTFSYAGSYGRYFNSSADNYNDHELTAKTSNQFTARADFGGTLYYLDRVDPRGLLARPQSDVPDHYTAWGGSGTFGYGARNAQGRFEADLGFTEKAYVNNRTVTQNFDVATMTVAGRFLYRVAPRTRALAELRVTEVDFKTSNRDNQEIRYLTGATWDLAAATSGTAKFGWMTKRFKDSALQDFSGPSLEASVRWAPLTYSAVDIIARRGAIDSAGLGFYTVDSSIGAQWTHRWGPFLSTRSGLTHTQSSFRGLTRTDNSTVAQVGAFTDLRSWLRLGVDYQFIQRKSTEVTAEFDRNVLMVTVGATL